MSRCGPGLMAGVLAGGLCLAAAAGASAGSPRLETSEEYFVLRIEAPFGEVMASLEAAIQRRNYSVGRVNDLDDTLRRRARDLGGTFAFDHYKVLSFCNLTLAAEVLEADPRIGALMPCRLAVFVPKGSAEVVVVTLRPTYLLRVSRSEILRRLAAQLEADILGILDMVGAR